MKNLFKTVVLLSLCQVSFGQDMGMGGPPPKKKEKSRSDLSPNKQKLSDIQKKYQNQIVFSNNTIINKEEDPATFIDTWELGDPLYFRMYQSNTLMEGVYDFAKKKGEKFDEYYFADFATLTVVYINGKEMATTEKVFSAKKEHVTDWITRRGTIKAEVKENRTGGDLGKCLKRAIHALGEDYKEGTLDLKFEVFAVSSAHDRPSNQRPTSERTSLLSTGKLKVKVTKEGMKNYAPMLCYKTMKNGTSMIDPELEKKVMVQFNSSYGNKVTDANITSEDWSIKKNVHGVPLRRNLSTNITYVHEGKEYITEYFINQTYSGNGYQKSVNSSSVGETRSYSPSCLVYKQELVK